jgi:predicted AlkP superfamily phosphohydrolase/phosphomutase
MSTRAIFIGLDGATFTLLDPLMEQGVMPQLQALVARGARAELRSVVPPLTPPAWTSLATGRSPGQHGIFDFFQLAAPGSTRIQLATANDLRCETVWAMANRAGLRTTVLNFPVMFPPPPLDGHVIAGWMPWRQLRLGCHPPEIYDWLRALPDFDPRELAMDMALEARATEGCAEDELAEWVELHIRRDQQWLAVLRHLMHHDPSDVVAILFDGPDKIQHLCWRFLDPALWPAAPTAQELAIRERCYAYFGQLDRTIGALVEAAGPQATIIVASDHGFGATTEVFCINAWLEQAGYLRWRSTEPFGGAQGTLGMNRLARHTQAIDWEHTSAYAATPTSNGVHIVRAAPGQPGVAEVDYARFRAELAARLLAFRDPASGEPVVTRIWTREEVFVGPAQLLAPDLTLALRDGGLVSILPSAQVLMPRPHPEGTHRPLGVFLACGPEIRRGLELPPLSILDVAPLLLDCLGLAAPAELEGRLPLELFEPGARASRPQTLEPGAATSVAPGQYAAYDEESERIIVERLRALGYLE